MSEKETIEVTAVDANMPYEMARNELVQVVRDLETGQAPLEESLKLWERGEALAQHCQGILDAASQRLQDAPEPEVQG